jgi:hypothetical protein
MTITDPTHDTANTTRPDVLIVTGDHTPGVHQADSDDIWWWLPIIGPTATVLAYNLARYARHADIEWPTEALARRVGLGGSTAALWRSLERLDSFHVAQFHSVDVLSIRLSLPALSQRQITRLPDDLANAYPHSARPSTSRPLRAAS